ncbi:hypothetical protein KBB96_20105 [Luteolibacter ambystomatis]|uniref:DUF4352 domain-containing protein n=1 Tax=Luteolibacter ambystomatis TaxID=2824561 RepID=A0A975G9Z9_9BACT|nr:hypothetical protein [Luteolibacter ambystomatis]QUE51145.1 hypothetical protein KBB96_20105 [Luteolibacter ambystomatis]
MNPPPLSQPPVQKSKPGCLKVFLIVTGLGAVAAIGGCALLAALVGASGKNKTERPVETFQIGDTVTFEDDSQWQVLEAKSLGSVLKGTNMLAETKRTDGKFLYVRYKITNTKNREERILDTPKLRDSKGREFEHLDGASLYLEDGENTLTLEQLTSGMSKSFSALYEVPSDASGFVFMTRKLGFGGDDKAVKLGF